jgi:hypothetical protein
LNSTFDEAFPQGLDRVPSRQLTSKLGVSQLSEKTGQEKMFELEKKTSSGRAGGAAALALF